MFFSLIPFSPSTFLYQMEKLVVTLDKTFEESSSSSVLGLRTDALCDLERIIPSLTKVRVSSFVPLVLLYLSTSLSC
jgi:hypothetical protein